MSRAFEQMAHHRTLTYQGVIFRRPTKLVNHRRKEERRIGYAPRYDYVRLQFEGADDLFRPEVGVGGNYPIFVCLDRLTLSRAQCLQLLRDSFEHIVAEQRHHP